MMTWQTTTELYPHQEPPVSKLIRSRVGGLLMEMGTGKTRLAIEFASIRQRKIDRVVWFCPVSLKVTIKHELHKHTDLVQGGVYVFDEGVTTRQRNLPRSVPWYVIGIESMSSSDRTVLAARELITPETFVIVDESSYIKGHRSRRTRRITALAERARYRMILTGTPMSQGVQDLFAQMRFLSPKILGYHSFYSFAANHLEYSDKYPGLIVRAHNTDWLAAKINPYVYQITKEDAGLNLPQKLYDQRYFLLTDEQEAAYEQAKWDILMSCPDDLLDSYVIFQLFTALQQIVSGFERREGVFREYPHRRLETLLDVIQSLPEGATSEKIIVWCKYRYSVRAIAEALTRQYSPDAVALYYGDLNEHERGQELERWRRESRFLVATQATGGHGLTLNEADYSIFYENSFKYADRLQAEDRNHRIGKTRRPTYIDIFGDCGIEDRIAKSHARKGDAVDDFRKKVSRVKDMSKAEAREYIRQAL